MNCTGVTCVNWLAGQKLIIRETSRERQQLTLLHNMSDLMIVYRVQSSENNNSRHVTHAYIKRVYYIQRRLI